MSLAIIAAVAENNIIGIKNALPWNIPEDLQRFKALTMGKTVLMGQKTFESLLDRLNRPLPGRKSVVVSNDPNFNAPSGVEVFRDLQQALDAYRNTELFVIGGGSIYRQTIDQANTLYITHVHKSVEGDVSFPLIDPKIWRKVEEEQREGFSFVKYQRA